MSLTSFIQSFKNRKGHTVLFSFVISKIANFLVTILVIRILTKADYGLIAYSLTVISFLAPFVGAGMHQGFLRYGVLGNSQIYKKRLFNFTFRKGIKYSAFLMLCLILLTPILTLKLPEARLYLFVMSFQLLSLFIFQMIQAYCRLIHRNKLFATIDIQNNLLLLVFNVLLCYLFGGIGYVVSSICIPLILSIYYLKKLKLPPFYFTSKINKIFEVDFKGLLRYGLYASIGSVLAQLLYAVDILLIGNLLSDSELVAQYKASNIIPFSLLMLPVAVMTTDFVILTNASIKDKLALKTYYINYLKIFSIICFAIVLFFYFFSEPLLSVFGENYKGHAKLMFIFAIGTVGGLLFRVPMGNMLSAIGWPKVNAIFSVIILIINLIASYFMILKYGIEGAAMTTSVLMWLSGFLSLGAFVYYLKN